MRKVISRLVIGLVLTIIVLLVVARVAAALRETQTRDDALPERGRLIETAMGQVYVEEAGPPDGQVVLLAHGSVAWARFWEETYEVLAEAGYRAVAFDMPPVGYSDRATDGDCSRQTSARRLLALVEALERKPVLVRILLAQGRGQRLL